MAADDDGDAGICGPVQLLLLLLWLVAAWLRRCGGRVGANDRAVNMVGFMLQPLAAVVVVGVGGLMLTKQ